MRITSDTDSIGERRSTWALFFVRLRGHLRFQRTANTTNRYSAVKVAKDLR
jgi:hypothetical protein